MTYLRMKTVKQGEKVTQHKAVKDPTAKPVSTPKLYSLEARLDVHSRYVLNALKTRRKYGGY